MRTREVVGTLVSMLKDREDELAQHQYEVQRMKELEEVIKLLQKGCVLIMPGNNGEDTQVKCDRAARHEGLHFNVTANVAWSFASEGTSPMNAQVPMSPQVRFNR